MTIARAAEDAAGNRLLFGVIGLVGLVVVWVAWSGRWRSWPNSPQTFWLVTVWPPTCLGFLLYALAPSPRDPVVVVLGLVIALWWLAGWVILLRRPAWYGPRWYREQRRDRAWDPRQDPMDARLRAMGGAVPPEQNSERVARAARVPREPIARRRVLLLDPDLGRPTPVQTEGAAAGHLLLYRDELVFAADRGDDATRPGPTVRALPAADITDIARADGLRVTGGQVRLATLRVATGDGREWRFEAVRPGATLADLRRVYLGGRSQTP